MYERGKVAKTPTYLPLTDHSCTTHVSPQVRSGAVVVPFSSNGERAVPLATLVAEDDDQMIAFTIVLVVLFLLALVALCYGMCVCYDTGFFAFAEMPERRERVIKRDIYYSGGYAAGDDNSSASSDSSYTSEVVTEYNNRGEVVQSRRSRLPSKEKMLPPFPPRSVAYSRSYVSQGPPVYCTLHAAGTSVE